jgi:PIN domain nuclease of toxin-antitoxin system
MFQGIYGMKYLLDTNIIIWYTEGNPMLPDAILEKIQIAENEIYVSIASLWEIAIKYSLGKLKLSEPLKQYFSNINQEYGISILSLSIKHILKQVELPFHHNDPFDRLIFAQSVTEKVELLYTDKIFDLYRSE